ncbi:helix-turn-helix domain-containing protein [Furfurilactobacillus curtus]|uniref:Transposase n=1 Tax=Furfurilactobacillus curtus TaxID=1746200 RepID=A0ABQ5JP44_9LACO
MTKYNYEFKAKIVAEYLAGAGSTTLAHKYQIPKCGTILEWVKKFQAYGVEGLEIKHVQRVYSSRFKQQVLNWMKQHQTSYAVTALHFNIPSDTTILSWQTRFEQFGIEGLSTQKRGRPVMKKHKRPTKAPNDDSDALKKLREENLMLRIENAYLKKLDALDREEETREKSHKSSQN